MKTDDAFCPNSKDGAGHCEEWNDGDACCRCGAPAMTDQEKEDQGMND
jgi:hypothetical protein